MRGLEGLLHGRARTGRHGDGRIGPGVADMGAHMDGDIALGHALARNLGFRLGCKLPGQRLDRRLGLPVEGDIQRRGPGRADLGEPHAIGREQPGERMQQHGLDAERVRDQAGVLASGPAEGVQRIARDVVAALHRDLLDRLGHVGDGDLDEAVGDLLGRAPVADFGRQHREFVADDLDVERLVLLRPEDRGEIGRDQLADHDVGIGHRERPAAAIGGRTGIGAGGVGADPEARAVIVEDRAAAGRDRVDQHHRRTHAHARNLRLEGALVLAVEMGNVGRGAAHVEADHLVEAGRAAGLGKADHAAGRTRQDRILALEQFGGSETARRHHEHQPRAGPGDVELLGNLLHIAAEDGREIGIDHGGVAAPDQLDQRRNLVADRDLREADLASDAGRDLLMGGIAITVHEDDRDGAEPGIVLRLERVPDRRLVGRALDGTVGQHALLDLLDRFVQCLGQYDLLGEDVRPRLVTDAQRVTEALGRDQQGAVALAFEQRIGGDRRAHAHLADGARRDRLPRPQPDMVADPLDRRIAIGAGILGKELPGMEIA